MQIAASNGTATNNYNWRYKSLIMLGSKSTFFIARSCNFVKGSCISSLDAKGYSAEQIAVYIKALITLGKPG
jgi:hypothetical protein